VRCPNCGFENISGVDLCEECGTDLAGLDLPEAEHGLSGRLLTDRVGDLPLAPPIVVSPETTVAEAVRKMREEKHGCVLVVEDSELVGIFTEKDLLSRILRKGADAEKVQVGKVMTTDPITLRPGDPPAFAIHNRVERDLRHLPVVEGGALLGFISVRHLLRYIHEDVIGAR